LLVLELTRSPADAGLTRFAIGVPLLLFMLPAGAILDRLNRKRVMMVCEISRGLAQLSVAVAIWVSLITFPHILLAAAIFGTGYAFFEVGQRSALPRLVPPSQLPAAVTQNQAREYGGLILGQALGGILFGISRLLPFAVDALSYAVSLLTLLLIRTDFQHAPQPAASPSLRREITEGIAWLLRQPFIRLTALLSAANDLVVNALFLAVIVLAQRRGAPPAVVGITLSLMGFGGLLGAVFAPRLAARLSLRTIAVATMAVPMFLAPFLLVAPGAIWLGVIYAGMFVLIPAWHASINVRQLMIIPDGLQSRVQSGIFFIGLSGVPIGSLAVGLLLESFGGGITVAILTTVLLFATVLASVARVLRMPPESLSRA